MKGIRHLSVLAAVITTGLALTVAPSAQARTPHPSDPTSTLEQKLADGARAAAADTLHFGAEPLADVTAAAEDAAAHASCDIDTRYAVALSIAMTWPETAPDGSAPSPMTLSRYDTQPGLGDPQGRAEGLWFHPGVGMWQLDSAGLGTNFTALSAMDTSTAAPAMVSHVVNRFCERILAGDSAPAARAAAWRPWHACDAGSCDTIFWRVHNNGVTTVDDVNRYGGGELRECLLAGIIQDCLYVDPAKAQGADWWASPDGGRSPLAAPFYVFRQDRNGTPTEIRFWLANDTGTVDLYAARELGTDARTGLTWIEDENFCDITTPAGDC